ncbi:MAG TPA: 1,4-dihydroxy-2-naphthoate polyprenyltransferase [Rhodocyclaceae bacterium]|nr:1,4-dihydroxy-2-naphthoate polyprenyltransferase [Rhodocyclaceae bacterium]
MKSGRAAIPASAPQAPAAAAPPSPWRIWFLALRPRTLSVSLSPVLVGTAAAWHDHGRILWLPLLAAILAAAFIQIGTNLFNDVGDFLRGTDTPDRLGPPRATAQGWLTPAQVQAGAWTAFGLAFLCGIYLAVHGGWPIVAIGLASLAAGWAYTGGPAPIAYRPLGEVFVWIFFGLVAVGGSYYLQTFTLSATALAAAALVGLHAAAVITVNNYRDLDGDARSGKRTLAVVLGRPATCRIYQAEMLLPYLLLPVFAGALGWAALLPLASLPMALGLLGRFRWEPPGPVFNQILGATARLQLVFALLLAIALMAPSLS